MIISSLKAMTGDSFVIKWERNSLLIDGGMPNTFSEIQRNIESYNLRAVFVTHVDYDHIGGIINLIKRPEVDISNCAFFMNNPDLASYYNGSEVKFEHGDTLQKMLKERGHEFLPVTNETAPIEIEGLRIRPLHPTKSLCKKLCDSWDLSRVWSEVKGDYDYHKSQKNNGDIINKASMCLIVEYKEKKILMLGDAHSVDVTESLKELEEYNFNLVKLSHHGSKHNTDVDLLEIIDCDDYIISTNSNSYNHPDPETIKLLSDQAQKKGRNFRVYLNYPIEPKIRQRYKEKYNADLDGLTFILQQDINCNVDLGK